MNGDLNKALAEKLDISREHRKRFDILALWTAKRMFEKSSE